jgi:arylsulfatase A-like enzyme
MKSMNLNRLSVVLAACFGLVAGVRAESLAAIFTNAPVRSTTAEAPSIIFIRCHGLGIGDLSCYGQTNFVTPNLDRLADNGVRFTDFHAGGTDFDTALAALVTGRRGGFVPGTMTVADRLHQAGYHTGLIGEWTLGAQPWRQGFDEFAGYVGGDEGRDYYADHIWRYAPNSIFDPTNKTVMDFTGNEMIYPNTNGKKGRYLPEVLMNAVISFAKDNQPDRFNHRRPFFLLADFPAPRSATKNADDFPVPSDAPFSDEPWPQAAKNRAALITRLDGGISGLLEKLQAIGMTNNVVIFFSSSAPPEKFTDQRLNFLKPNGAPNGAVSSATDPAAAPVPMIIYGPGQVVAGQINAAPHSNLDFLPTVLGLASVRSVPKTDGHSLVPLLHGEAEHDRENLPH